MFFSKTTGGFYLNDLHGDSIPADAVEVSAKEYKILLDGQASGLRIICDSNGNPSLQKIETTRKEIEDLRLRAYADPINGSDRYFAEATRLQVVGGTPDEIEAVQAAGASRYAEIQGQYPWP